MSEEGEKQEAGEKRPSRARKSSEGNGERKQRSSKHRSSSRDSHDDILGGPERKSSRSKTERRRSKDDDDGLDGKRSSHRPSRRKSRDSHDDEGAESGKRSSDHRPSRRKSKDSHDDELGGRSSGRPSRRKSRDSSDDDALASDKNESAFTEDQKAKSRARRKSSGSAMPGAFVETKGEDRATRRKDRESKDKEAKNRARRQAGEANPASSRENGDKRAKDNARRAPGSGAARPGASSEARGPRPAKSIPSNARELTVAANNDTEEPKPPSTDGNLEVKAIAVDEVENEKLKQQQSEIEDLRRTVNNFTRNQNDEPEESPSPPEENKASGRKKCIYLIIALVLIGAGVAGYLLGTKDSSVVEEPAEANGTPTEPPTVASELLNPSSTPTAPPTEFQLYEEPSPEDCAAIAVGNEIDDQDLFAKTKYVLELDATLTSDIYEEATYLLALNDALQAIWMPEVAGCTTRRHLREGRILQELPDYVVANGLVLETMSPTGSSCQDGSDTLCVRIAVTLDLWLREDVRGIALLGHLATVLGDDPVERMVLQTLFVSIAIVNGYPAVVTPTDRPTEDAMEPTDAPSAGPSFAPVTGPTTDRPTKKPTESPTGTPTTLAPTMAPVVGSTPEPTASPTVAPVVEPTPPPTAFPTKAPVVGPTPPPTAFPTKTPTQSPTPKPSVLPTEEPTLLPSARPSTLPSSSPTLSQQPSEAPSEVPSLFPSASPSSSPTPMPSLITSSAVATMSSEYYCLTNYCDEAIQLTIPAGGREKATDGDTDVDYSADTSMHTWEEYNPWFTVTFNTLKVVAKVVVWKSNSPLAEILGCEVELLNFNGDVLASSPIESEDDFTEHDFGTSGVNSVKTIRVVQKKDDKWYFLSLAEVQIFGVSGEDIVANDLSAFPLMSTGLTCGFTCVPQFWYLPQLDASKAIDGNFGQTLDDGLAHTQLSYYPWWKVDLGFTATVHRVRIWNRSDEQNNFLNSFLEFLDSSDQILYSVAITTVEDIYTFESESLGSPVSGVAALRIAKYIEIPQFIYIPEFEAFGYQTS